MIEDPQAMVQAVHDGQGVIKALEIANLGGDVTIISFVIYLLNSTEKRILERITQIVSLASNLAPPGELKELLESIARLLRAIARELEKRQGYPSQNYEDSQDY